MNDDPIHRRALKQLREIRERQGLTLREVEIKSHGRWRASVVGSYERGARKPALSKIIELCNFYGVSVSSLFTNDVNSSAQRIIDLKALTRNPGDEVSSQISRFAFSLLNRRGDWNGQVLSLREDDLEVIAVILNMTEAELEKALALRGLLLKSKSHL